MTTALRRVQARSSERLTSFDWFDRLTGAPQPSDPGWRDLVSVLGLCRRLSQIGTTPAVRLLLDAENEFGEAVRIDVESTLVKLADRAVPALLEARKAESRPFRAWVTKMLEALGKHVPGEAVQTTDDQVLCDVLTAYGRTKDTDATRVVLTFANSDRTQIREAARNAVLLYGDTALPALRESYEAMEARKPPEDWSWEVLTAQLFRVYDRARLSDAYASMDRGLALQQRGDLEAMCTAFDQVLARAPDFERRSEMAPGYLALARSVQATDRPRALALVRKAARLDLSGTSRDAVESERLYLEALDLMDRGIVDHPSLQRAVELDRSNEAAVATLRAIDQESMQRMRALYRTLAIAAAGLVAIFAGATMLLRRHRRRQTPSQ